MKKLLIASKNVGKIKELTEFLSDLPVQLISLKEVCIEQEIQEDGKTYKENSQKKALFFAKISGLPTIADDGGLEIDALGGVPGINSRRWLGYEATDEELIDHLQKISKKLPENNRNAQFKTVVSFALPNGKVWSFTGIVKGIIAKKPLIKRSKGYPYRSFFYLPKLKKYYFETELLEEEKKIYNHRYKAVQKLIPIIKNVIHFVRDDKNRIC